MTYHTVYDETAFSYDALIGIAFAVLFLWGAWRTWRNGSAKTGLLKFWYKFLAAAAAIISVLAIILLTIKTLASFAISLGAAYADKTAEGKVAQFRPMPESLEDPGHFCVDKTCFDYRDYAFNTLLKDGLQVQVLYAPERRGEDGSLVDEQRIYKLGIAVEKP